MGPVGDTGLYVQCFEMLWMWSHINDSASFFFLIKNKSMKSVEKLYTTYEVSEIKLTK